VQGLEPADVTKSIKNPFTGTRARTGSLEFSAPKRSSAAVMNGRVWGFRVEKRRRTWS